MKAKSQVRLIMSAGVLSGAFWAGPVLAQIPGVPGAGVPGAGAAGAGVPGVGGLGAAAGGLNPAASGLAPGPTRPGAGGTLLSKLGLSKEQREFCRRELCKGPIGQFLTNATRPLTLLTGGIIPPFCPQTPSAAELADEGPIGAAAKVQADEAQAAQRKAAVRFLGTVDCSYWPEAEDALIQALREDRNECVRFEAAVALSKGCCCTKKTIAALTNTISCTAKDGGFVERSMRVRIQALKALQHCLACFNVPAEDEIEEEPEKIPPPLDKPEDPTKPQDSSALDGKGIQRAGGTNAAPGKTKLVGYYERVNGRKSDSVLADARRAYALAVRELYPQKPGGQTVYENRDQSLSAIIDRAYSQTNPQPPVREHYIQDPRTGAYRRVETGPVSLMEALHEPAAPSKGERVYAPKSLLGGDPEPPRTPPTVRQTTSAPQAPVSRQTVNTPAVLPEMLPRPAAQPTINYPQPPRPTVTTPMIPTPPPSSTGTPSLPVSRVQPAVQTPRLSAPTPALPTLTTPRLDVTVKEPVAVPTPTLNVVPPTPPTIPTPTLTTGRQEAPQIATPTLKVTPPPTTTIGTPKLPVAAVEPTRTPTPTYRVPTTPRPLPPAPSMNSAVGYTTIAPTALPTIPPSTPKIPAPAVGTTTIAPIVPPAPIEQPRPIEQPKPVVMPSVAEELKPVELPAAELPQPAPMAPVVLAVPLPATAPAPADPIVEPPVPVAQPVYVSEEVRTALSAERPRERELALRQLTKDDLQSGGLLAKVVLLAVGDSSTDVRKEAIRTLARSGMNTPEVVDLLRRLGDDPNPSVRTEAAIALARVHMAD